MILVYFDGDRASPGGRPGRRDIPDVTETTRVLLPIRDFSYSSPRPLRQRFAHYAEAPVPMNIQTTSVGGHLLYVPPALWL